MTEQTIDDLKIMTDDFLKKFKGKKQL